MLSAWGPEIVVQVNFKSDCRSLKDQHQQTYCDKSVMTIQSDSTRQLSLWWFSVVYLKASLHLLLTHVLSASQCILKEITLVVVSKVSSSKMQRNAVNACVNVMLQFSDPIVNRPTAIVSELKTMTTRTRLDSTSSGTMMPASIGAGHLTISTV